MNLIDSHCHLDVEQFDSDRADVFARAAAADVGLIVVPGIDQKMAWHLVEPLNDETHIVDRFRAFVRKQQH